MPHQIPVERDSQRCDGANMRRRDFLALMGIAAGSAAMYRAMTSLSVAAESTYAGPIRLDGDPKGTSIIILGAGLAGMVAALELRKSKYRVQVLEYNSRAGGAADQRTAATQRRCRALARG